MPIYEYKCLECGNHLEAMQKISDEPLKECPKCSGKLEKQWSRTGFQFKGSGWYVTDYAGKGSGENKSETKNETSGSTDSAKTSATETSSGSESTASGGSASKSETKTTSPDKSST